ncbi:hypothetical protein B0H13DRAFT_1868502 [Mycena leptocephala]|nr:hypothetical protein B0H13DRAFT_1868502 [Mycena leptocephala]
MVLGFLRHMANQGFQYFATPAPPPFLPPQPMNTPSAHPLQQRQQAFLTPPPPPTPSIHPASINSTSLLYTRNLQGDFVPYGSAPAVTHLNPTQGHQPAGSTFQLPSSYIPAPATQPTNASTKRGANAIAARNRLEVNLMPHATRRGRKHGPYFGSQCMRWDHIDGRNSENSNRRGY